MSATGYRHITCRPGPELYSDHNRERHFACRACGAQFVARTPKALWCPQCRVLPLRVRQVLARERRGDAR